MPESDEICTECPYSVLNVDGDVLKAVKPSLLLNM